MIGGFIMTEKELKQRIEVRHHSSGSYKVTIYYRGKWYSCVSNNSLAYDDMDRFGDNAYYTSKQAYMAFWNECKHANNLR